MPETRDALQRMRNAAESDGWQGSKLRHPMLACARVRARAIERTRLFVRGITAHDVEFGYTFR